MGHHSETASQRSPEQLKQIGTQNLNKQLYWNPPSSRNLCCAVAAKLKQLALTASEVHTRTWLFIESVNNNDLGFSFFCMFVCFGVFCGGGGIASPHRLLVFRWMLPLCFASKLQKCFVDKENFLWLSVRMRLMTEFSFLGWAVSLKNLALYSMLMLFQVTGNSHLLRNCETVH